MTQLKTMLVTDGVTIMWRCNGNILPTRDETTEYETAGHNYEGWNFNSGNYLFTTDTK